MITIESLTVRSYDIKTAILEWEYAEASPSFAGITLEIYRSETPEPSTMFSGIEIALPPTTQIYQDTSIIGLNSYQFHDWYYKIKVIDANTPGTVSWSDPARLELPQDARTKIMIKQKSVGIKKFGIKVKILKKRVSQGTQCSCWDETLQRSITDDCPYCNGTGIMTTGGYYDSIEVNAAMNTNPAQNQITPFGVWQQQDTLMDILNYPTVHPDDVVVDQLNKRYKIKQVAPFEKGQTLISQRCILSLQERSSQVYDIEVGP